MTDIGEVRTLMTRMTGDEKHDAAATSTLDVLHVLYDRVLRVDPARPDDPARDRFLLSKGHGPMAYYAVLAAKGFLDPDELAGWTGGDSRLGYHPDRVLVPGVEIGSGSLGHGLPLAVGTALGLRARGLHGPRVVVLVGDAELDEGSNHEAIAYAGRRGLPSLTAVVVDNDSATHRGALAGLFVAEGWRAITVDGDDHDALELALTAAHPDRPLAVVVRTTRKAGDEAKRSSTTDDGSPMTTMLQPTTMREAFLDVVAEAVDADERVALVLADISAASVPDLAARHPDRVVNVGIREQLMIGVAGGMALAGRRPVVHTYAPFLVERPFESLKLDLGHQGVDAVLVSIGASHDAAEAGRTHQAPGDVALLDTLAGWSVHVPGHPDEAAALLRRVVPGTGSHYVRLSEATNAAPHPDEGVQVLRRGSRGVVLAVGPTLDAVLDATAGDDVTVAYTATPRPFDGAGLRAAVGDGPADVVVVEPYLAGTSARVVADALADRPHRQLGLGVRAEELRRYGTRAEHDAAHGLDGAGLRAACARFLGP